MAEWFLHALVRLAGRVFFLGAIAVATSICARSLLLEGLRLLGLGGNRMTRAPALPRPSRFISSSPIREGPG